MVVNQCWGGGDHDKIILLSTPFPPSQCWVKIIVIMLFSFHVRNKRYCHYYCIVFHYHNDKIHSSLGVYLTDNFILATEVDLESIYQVSLEDGKTVRLPVHADNPMSVVYDPTIQKIFWVSQADSMVLSSRLNGSEEKVIKTLTYGKSEEKNTIKCCNNDHSSVM